MPRQASFYSVRSLGAIIAFAVLHCTPVNDPAKDDSFTFTVVDVGQGLAQIGVRHHRAVLWDMGIPDSFTSWKAAYEELGKPFIEAIVFSHGDRDHTGGLSMMGSSINFSGQVYVRPGEDTAAIRQNAASTGPRLHFTTVSQGDTPALLDDVAIECLWPPADPPGSGVHPDDGNRMSLCFQVRYGGTSIMLTGDIDTGAERTMNDQFPESLQSDLLIVPHHGSAGSLNPVFLGYVAPLFAVISCGLNNTYNHPSAQLVKLLTAQMHTTLLDTRFDGSIVFSSNSEYWTIKTNRPAEAIQTRLMP
jgi:competence protein ComEC